MPSPEFHVVGDALIDVLANGIPALPAWGGDVYASGIHIKAGGSALNTAVHLASILGSSGSVSFHACVGQDTSCRTLRSCLEDAGVRPCLTVLPEQPTGSCIVLSGSADRSFITCMGAAGCLSADHLSGITSSLQNQHTSAPCHVHFAGFYSYGPLRQELPDFVRGLRLVAADRGLHLTISMDVNGYEASQVEGASSVLELLDLWKGNVFESEAVAGCAKEQAVRSLAGKTRCAIVTQGRDGASFCGPQGEGHVPAPAVALKDSTGAGDAFAAALLAAWVSGQGLEAAVAQGCAAGALNCTHIGGCDTPVTAQGIRGILST
ncbi:unnamed protein product [Polarella glacialis]|uniref:Adenosine kinase n=1 Tax=Polarella glacialis TaxID=89957 RepID=A0A813FWA1_POLGL|nr:unnamed protein product [Polarella glacialis]